MQFSIMGIFQYLTTKTTQRHSINSIQQKWDWIWLHQFYSQRPVCWSWYLVAFDVEYAGGRGLLAWQKNSSSIINLSCSNHVNTQILLLINTYNNNILITKTNCNKLNKTRGTSVRWRWAGFTPYLCGVRCHTRHPAYDTSIGVREGPTIFWIKFTNCDNCGDPAHARKYWVTPPPSAPSTPRLSALGTLRHQDTSAPGQFGTKL